MTIVSGGIGLLTRTRRGLAGPLGTMKAYRTQDAPGTDEAARVGSPPPRADNHRF